MKTGRSRPGAGFFSPRAPRVMPPRSCIFCTEELAAPDVEDREALRRFLSPQAKILPRRKTGVCSKHQRRLARAIKRAREIGLLPYAGQR